MIKVGRDNVESASSMLEAVVQEIFYSYGDTTVVRRKSLHKFGANQDVGTTGEDINWDGIEPLHSTTNSIDTFSSSDNSDTQTLRVEGMYFDANNDMFFAAQNITLTGQTQGTLSQPLCRVTRIANVANATATLGDVYVYEAGAATLGVPNNLATIGNIMPFEHQSTMFAGTSVASTNYLAITNVHMGAGLGGTKNTYVDVTLQIRDKDSVYRTVNIWTVSTASSGVSFELNPPLIVPPNSDIDLTATGLATGAYITAGFDGYFADILIDR